MKISTGFLITVSIFMLGCVTSNHFEEYDKQEVKTISQEKFKRLRTDPFQIESYARYGDLLYLQLSYGGGCGTADFSLFSNEKEPQQVKLQLVKNDKCKAIKRVEQVYKLPESMKKKDIILAHHDTYVTISNKTDTRISK